MNRIYHPYHELEEFKMGMWKIVRGDDRSKNSQRAADLMRDTDRFIFWMTKVANEWTKSCEHNLTCEESNRLAWLGHAGCLLGANSPEENTRIGWHTLTTEEQDAANEAAQTVLNGWIERHKSFGAQQQLELNLKAA